MNRRSRAFAPWAWASILVQMAAWSISPEGLLGITAALAGSHQATVTLADGHVDLVLHHGCETAPRPTGGDPESVWEHGHVSSDHVVHLCGSDRTLAMKREGCDDLGCSSIAALAPSPLGLPVEPSTAGCSAPPPDGARIASSLVLRATIVLRA